jgi:hypothetical protein
MGAAAVAVILMKERHIADAFRTAGATSAAAARLPQDLNVGMHGAGWRVLHRNAFVREAGEGRYYLDVPNWDASNRARRQRALIAGIIVLALLLSFYLSRR